MIPIPNFVPNSNIGLQGLINDAHAAMGYGNGFGHGGPAVLVNDREQQNSRGRATIRCWRSNSTPAARRTACRRRRCRSAPGRAAWAAAPTPTSIRSST